MTIVVHLLTSFCCFQGGGECICTNCDNLLVTALQKMLDTDGLACRVSTSEGLMIYFNSMLREFIIFNDYFWVRNSFVFYIAQKCSRTLNVINRHLKSYINRK